MTHDQSDAELCGDPFAQAPPVALSVPPVALSVPPAMPSPPPPGRRAAPAGGLRLDAESRRRIGRNLRLLYGDVLSQPLPARFETLLADLSARDETGGAA